MQVQIDNVAVCQKCSGTSASIAGIESAAAGYRGLRGGLRTLLLVLPLAAFGLAAAPAAAQTAAERGTALIWSHPQEPPNWNYWQTGNSALKVPVFHNVLEPLVEKLGDGSVGPLLAESWTISDDGLEYVFVLREAKFHDGTTLDAADVVYSLLKNKESPQAPMKTPLAPVASVEALDDRTVKLTLSVPSQRLLGELGQDSGVIVPENAYETYDLNTRAIGTGPYVFSELRPDVHVQLVRFAEYWGELPYFETITHRFISDETAAINALLAGDIHMIATVLGEGLDRIETLAQNRDYQVILPAPIEINYVMLGTQNPILQDRRVRQAIAHAIEREEVVIGGQSGFAEPICTFVVPFTEPWNTGYCPYEYDQDKARALLAEAGHPNLTLDFPHHMVAEHPAIKEVLAAQFANVGIKVNTKPLDLANFGQQVNQDGLFDLTNVTTGAKAEAFVCKGGRQPFGRANAALCDEAFDALVGASDSVLGREAYVAAMTEMVKVFADSAWVIPLHSKSSPTVARADLTGFKGYRYRLEMDARKLRWADRP